ncbi:hypothetical protein E3N88_35984 [Mikania micrantha]|uniref:Uncharacterized protein n=1 Tax=Mikania micrantha TaxID=192012 RepID=A0A5N6M2G4_9ASTR|nr:hypothetical protein E3N88_35984 [Mikania micrantha]
MENRDYDMPQSPSFVTKALSRDSSVGRRSSSTYYRSAANEGVPFDWEMQPGTPKKRPQEEIIPPPTPPPAMQSLAFSRPNTDLFEKGKLRISLPTSPSPPSIRHHLRGLSRRR